MSFPMRPMRSSGPVGPAAVELVVLEDEPDAVERPNDLMAEPSARRGGRASYYRQSPPKRKRETEDEERRRGELRALMPPPPPPSSTLLTPHEQLLDASEEGDLEGVLHCLRSPDSDIYLNLNGIARGIVYVKCPETGATLDWGHPEKLACGRGDTALRYASFHGYAPIVAALLDAGAVPGLRNDEANSALALAQCALGMVKAAAAKRAKATPVEDMPRGTAEGLTETIKLLEEASRLQWVIVNYRDPSLVGRIAQVASDELATAITATSRPPRPSPTSPTSLDRPPPDPSPPDPQTPQTPQTPPDCCELSSALARLPRSRE